MRVRGSGRIQMLIEVGEQSHVLLVDTGGGSINCQWEDSEVPTEQANRVQEYTVPDHAQDAYEEELVLWQHNRLLLPYSEEELGLLKGLIPLMAVMQEHKQKVRPVPDYQKLNGFVKAFTANAEVCTQRL